MRVARNVFRMSVWLATSSLTLTSIAPSWAQPAPPPGAPQGTGGDPPAIAGRLAQMSGSVSFHTAADQSWTAAIQNYPVTAGDSYWTEPQAGATLEIGQDEAVLDGSTELDVGSLDQQQFAVTEPQGAVYLQLSQLPDGQSVTVNTPRASVQITAVGRYEIVAGDTNNPTEVTVVEGAAHVTGTGVTLDVGPQQTASITGADSFQGNVGPIQQDGFLQAQLNKPAPPAADVPKQVACMTGGQQLAQYGSWSQTSQYGQVWYPSSVPADWAPYREGHWSYVAPWGWTWIDNEPWGFAPFHYGRWVQYGGRWGWVAAAPDAPYEPYPVYAPAMVSFVDVGGAALAGFAAGAFVGGAIGWFPLGFREPYYPSYHVSERYLQHINRISVVNVRNITINNERNFEVNRFANARFATVMPARDMARAVNVASVARPLPAAALAGAHPVFGRAPIAPVAARIGRPAPGPAFHPGMAAGGRPALRPAGLPANLHPAEVRGPVGGVRPGLPPLRSPGATPRGVEPQHVVRPIERTAPGLEHREAEPGRTAAPERAAPEAARRPEAVHPAAPHREPAAVRPEAHSAARPEAHAAPRPEVRPAARPEEHVAPRHEEHAAPRPQEHAAPRPQEHAAPRPEAHPHPAAPHPAPHPDDHKH